MQTENISSLPLTHRNVLKVFDASRERMLLEQGKLWHKIIIHNVAKGDMDKVLALLFATIAPANFVVLSLQKTAKDLTFIARNCVEALEMLCKKNLYIANPDGDPYVISIILAYSNTDKLKFPIHEKIREVLNCRLNNRVLDLQEFHKEPNLLSLIYCSLQLPKMLEFVLSIAKVLQFEGIKLGKNNLDGVAVLDQICKDKKLTFIDLSNNKIEDVSVFKDIQSPNITELNLDGNPCCRHFELNDRGYSEALKAYFPNLRKLDGVALGCREIPLFRRNFLIKPGGKEFVEQFLEHFFTLYDSDDRSQLQDLYYPRSLFSISACFIPKQSTSHVVRLDIYMSKARNLLSHKANGMYVCLSNGPRNIMQVFRYLPKTQHDPYSFSTDLVCFTGTTAIIIVTGVFREACDQVTNTDRIFGFTRTFILAAGHNGEFNITNEQLHISNATSAQASVAFSVKIAMKPWGEDTNVAQTENEKILAMGALQRITWLNYEWCKKFLIRCGWNIKDALEVFMAAYQSDQIPKKAFVFNKTLDKSQA